MREASRKYVKECPCHTPSIRKPLMFVIVAHTSRRRRCPAACLHLDELMSYRHAIHSVFSGRLAVKRNLLDLFCARNFNYFGEVRLLWSVLQFLFRQLDCLVTIADCMRKLLTCHTRNPRFRDYREMQADSVSISKKVGKWPMWQLGLFCDALKNSWLHH